MTNPKRYRVELLNHLLGTRAFEGERDTREEAFARARFVADSVRKFCSVEVTGPDGKTLLAIRGER